MTAETLLAASWSDGLFVGRGDVWHQELAGLPLRGLAPDGRGGALVIVGGRSLRRRSAEGVWSSLTTADSELSCCMTVGDAIYVGTEDARILRLGPHATLARVTAFEGVAGRETWYAGTALIDGEVVGPPLGVRSLSATCDGGALFANIHLGGLPRSLDRGATWAPTIDIDADVHEVCAHPANPRLVVAAAAVGLCVSKDSGATWTVHRDGLHAPHCSAVTFAGSDIFVSASEDPFSARGALYRCPIESRGPLQVVAGGLPEWTDGRIDTGCLASCGAELAAADAGGNLYVSKDAGRTWSCRSHRIPSPSGVLLHP
jgi:hypothetical protein